MFNPELQAEAGFYISDTKNTPFWIRANQFGEVPIESPGFTFRWQIRKGYTTNDNNPDKKKSLVYGYGIRTVINAGKSKQFLLSEAYFKTRYGAFEMMAGRRQEITGLVDSTLTSGSYAWSGNALSVPKVEISIPDFTPILNNKLISVKANFAHGWLGSADSVRHILLHQKSLYIRLGKPSWRFKIYAGGNHQVQWGGTLRYSRIDNGVQITKFGTDLRSYSYVVFAKSLYNLDTLVVRNGQATAEGGNRVGNHLGTIDFGLEYETAANKFFFYRQSIYEAGALFYLANIADGLNGIAITRKKRSGGLKKIVIEYLQTTNQGGPYLDNQSSIPQLRGVEDYFNNGRYIDGWMYKGQVIGTPFIMPRNWVTGLSPELNKSPRPILNNRVKSFNIAVSNSFRQLEFITRLSISQNFGSYLVPFDVNQISIQERIMISLKQYTLITTIAYDNQGVLKRSSGVQFLVKRSF